MACSGTDFIRSQIPLPCLLQLDTEPRRDPDEPTSEIHVIFLVIHRHIGLPSAPGFLNALIPLYLLTQIFCVSYPRHAFCKYHAPYAAWVKNPNKFALKIIFKSNYMYNISCETIVYNIQGLYFWK
jgi:hypothetical protein